MSPGVTSCTAPRSMKTRWSAPRETRSSWVKMIVGEPRGSSAGGGGVAGRGGGARVGLGGGGGRRAAGLRGRGGVVDRAHGRLAAERHRLGLEMLQRGAD